MKEVSRLRMAHLPTALEPLDALSEELGIDLWIKRDDQTGLAFGGNKTRKLEYLVADAVGKDCDTLVTAGAPQSNHCRQTAAAAARHDLRVSLVLGGTGHRENNGNLFLSRLLGADIEWVLDGESRDEKMNTVCRELSKQGRTPYLIPVGGSNGIGSRAYYDAFQELGKQMKEVGLSDFDRIVLASSSGGTHAGLAVGAYLAKSKTQVLGISVDEPKEALQQIVSDLTRACGRELSRKSSLSPDDIFVCADYAEPGYAVLTDLEREAITLFAQREGILLDPVYTGRGAAGLIDLVRKGEIERGERILFWHTGGAPALFPYAGELLNP